MILKVKKGPCMRILAIDTSNQTLTIALWDNQEIMGEYTLNVKKNHSLSLMPAITNLMADSGLQPHQLDRIVVAKGPGSYTGLRIGVTTAKTLAYTLKKELVGISSLKSLAANCVTISGLIVPLFDARRENVYTGAYLFREGNLETVLADRHISIVDWLHELQKREESIYFVGTDTDVFRNRIKTELPSAKVNEIPQWQIPHASVLAQLGRITEPITDIHAFLPSYLKRVEAEEKWLKDHEGGADNYVEKI